MYCKIRVTLRNEKRESPGHGFGRGIEQLLEGIDQHGSLNRAAKDMGMAYSKAWRIIKQAEEEFQTPLLERNGPHGSELTPEGRELFRRYKEMLAAAEAAVKTVFDRYYS